MLNFVQLALQAKDPAYQEQRRQKELAEEQKIAKQDALCGAAIDLLVEKSHLDQYALSEKEGAFLRSARYHFSSRRYLTEPQEKWLLDLASRHGHIFDSVPGAFAFRYEGEIIAVYGHGGADRKKLSSNDEFTSWAQEVRISPVEVDTALALIHVSVPQMPQRQNSESTGLGEGSDQTNENGQDATIQQPRRSLTEKLAARKGSIPGAAQQINKEALHQPVRNRPKG